MRATLLGLCVTVSVNLAAGGDNWPEFRGPTGDGHSDATNVPLTWSETENVVWKTAIHDHGWSSPVVWGDQVWVTTARQDGTELFAVCVDRGSGRIAHDVKVFDVEHPGRIANVNSYASPTPAIEAGRVYVHYGTYGTACLDTATGKTLWTRRDLNCDHHMGPGSSPVLFGDLLLFHVDGMDVQYVVALDKHTGKTAWKTDRSIDYSNVFRMLRKAFSTPSVIRAAGRLQMISPGSKAVMAYDPDTGKELWKVRYFGWSMVARPLYGHGLVFVVVDYERPELWAIRPDGSGDVTGTHVAWKLRSSVPATPSLLLIDGSSGLAQREPLLFMVSDDGILSCVEAKSGEVVWRERIGGNFSASPLYAAGRIYVFDQEAKTTVLRRGRKFTPLATNHLTGPLKATPAITGNSLYLRTATHLYRLEDK